MLIHNNSQDEENSSFVIYNPLKKHVNPSSSLDDIFLFSKRNSNKNKLIHNHPFIYSNIKINKAPTLNQVKKEILYLSSRAKKRRSHMVNSLHRISLRKALLKEDSNNDLLITSSKGFYKNNSELHISKLEKQINILNNSSMQDTSNCFNNSIDYANRFNISAYESIAQDIKKEKMSLKIGSLYAFSNSKPDSFVKRCLNSSIIEGFTESRRKKITIMQEELQNKIDNLDNIKHQLIYNKKLFDEGYFKIFNTYVVFLNKQIKKEALLNEFLSDKKRQIELEVKKLRTEINRKRKIISKDVEIRNFLILVKEKRNYNPLLIEYLANGKENELLHESKEQIEKYKGYLNPKKPIFNSIAEFMNCFAVLEKKGFKLLMESEKIALGLELLKESLSELNEEEKKHEDVINKQIIYKQKILEIRKAIYFQLVKQRNGLFNYISANSNFNLNDNLKNSQKKSVISTFDQEFLAEFKYKDLIKKYQTSFSLLYIQLLEQVNIILDLKVITIEQLLSIGMIRTNAELYEICNVNLSKKNENEIRAACLKLINIYERAIILIYEKHKLIKKNPLLKAKIVHLTLQRQNYLKIKKAETQRKLLEEQRKFEINKVINKTNKNIFHPRKKVQEKIKVTSSLNIIDQHKTDDKIEEPKFSDFVSSENIE